MNNSLNTPLRTEPDPDPASDFRAWLLKDANGDTIARGLTKENANSIVEMSRDKERLDWVEKHRVQLNCTQGAPGNYHYQVGTLPSESSYRKAIDAQIARKAALAVGGEEPQ